MIYLQCLIGCLKHLSIIFKTKSKPKLSEVFVSNNSQFYVGCTLKITFTFSNVFVCDNKESFVTNKAIYVHFISNADDVLLVY